MKLWLLCFVILFAAAEGLQNFGGWSNLFSGGIWSPLTVLAGVGLAVLSNAQALGLTADRTTTSAAPDQPRQPASSSPASPPLPSPPVAPSPQPQGKAQAKPSNAQRVASPKGSSISFDIPKPAKGRKSSRQTF